MKRLMTLLVLIVLLLSLTISACSSKKVTEPSESDSERTIDSNTDLTTIPSGTEAMHASSSQTVEETEPEPTETEAEPDIVPQGARPLFSKKLPIAVMINNTPSARPQSGLGQAKLIYQLLTEGRTTRFLMFTDIDKGVIGPVRSARPAYLDLVTQYKALYTYAGNGRVIDASPVNSLIRRIDALGAAGGLFYRTTHRKAPHNLYIKAEAIYKFAEKRAPVSLSKPLSGLAVRNGFVAPKGGVKATRIDYRFSSPSESFRYNEGKKKYIKYNGDTVLVDEQTRKAVEVGNVFLIYMPHGKMPNGVHNKVDWVGSGKALYFTGGRQYEVTWSKASHASPVYFKLNGERLVLNPGLTWVVVLDGQANKTVSVK